MNYSLFVVFEGSENLGPVPICRIVDAGLTKIVANFALAKATRSATALRTFSDEASDEAFCEADRLRSIIATI